MDKTPPINLPLVISGGCLLALAVLLGSFAYENRSLAQRVYAPQQQISAAHLAQWGPQNHHSVRLTSFNFGTPIIEPNSSGKNYRAVWFPIFPESNTTKVDDETTAEADTLPKILLHSTKPQSAEQIQTILDQAAWEGVVLNGLPLWKTEIPAVVREALPGLETTHVLVISDEASRWPAVVLIAAMMAFTCCVVGTVTLSNGLRPTPPTEPTAEHKRLPLLAIPVNVRTQPVSADNFSRAYFHPVCQTATKVTGDDLVVLESAFKPLTETYCCGCERSILLNQMFWCDTGENVLEYRLRLQEQVTYWQRLYLTYVASPYVGALNLGLNERGVQVGEVGGFTWPPELEGKDPTTTTSNSEGQPHENVHAMQNIYFGPLTVNEFGLQIATAEGNVTAIWDDLVGAEISQGELVLELTTPQGLVIYRIRREEIPNADRFLQFLAEVAPTATVIA